MAPVPEPVLRVARRGEISLEVRAQILPRCRHSHAGRRLSWVAISIEMLGAARGNAAAIPTAQPPPNRIAPNELQKAVANGMRLARVESESGHDMSQSSKLSGVAVAKGIKRIVTIDSLLAAGRATVLIAATACAFLGSRATSALADAAVQDGAPTCVTCHGMHGEGTPGGVPRLAGQNADYMSHALSMFKAGTRAGAIMQPIARNLSDTEIRRLADYFSTQNAPLAGAAASASPQLVLAGKQLAEMGDANAAACFSCHAAQGKGNGARFPSIAGEPAQFVINRLHEFQARARGKTPQPGTMTAVASTLDERQIEEAAAYLSQLEP
jgi:cytochrome c553